MRDRPVDHGFGEPGRVDADPQLVAVPGRSRDGGDALVDETRQLASRTRVAATGAHGENVAGLADHPDERGHLDLAFVGKARALLQLAVGVDVGGIGVDREPAGCRCCPHRPGTLEQVGVRCLGSLHAPEIRTGEEAEQRRVRGQGVAPAKALCGPVLQQRDVGEEVAARQWVSTSAR